MSHITVFNNEKAFLRKFLIFVVFSAIILLSFASCGKTETGESAETGAETLSEHVTETETSAATETYIPDDNFVTIDGVLTEYKGTDTVVTIPDYVTEIADCAFEGAPNADKITEIRLGKNTENLYPLAFKGLISLEKVIPNENSERFGYEDRGEEFRLFSNDTPRFIYCFSKRQSGISLSGYDVLKPSCTYFYNDCLVNFSFDSEISAASLQKIEIKLEFGEKTETFHAFFNHESNYRMFSAGNAFVFEEIWYNFGISHIFADEKWITYPSAEEKEKLNFNSISVGVDDEGHLCYDIIANEFLEYPSPVRILSYITSGDMFYRERGRVKIQNGKVVLEKTEEYDMSHYFSGKYSENSGTDTDLSGFYKYFDDNIAEFNREKNTDIKTVEELFEYNKSHPVQLFMQNIQNENYILYLKK